MDVPSYVVISGSHHPDLKSFGSLRTTELTSEDTKQFNILPRSFVVYHFQTDSLFCFQPLVALYPQNSGVNGWNNLVSTHFLVDFDRWRDLGLKFTSHQQPRQNSDAFISRVDANLLKFTHSCRLSGAFI